MKAIICTKYGPPEVLQETEIDKPVPKNNEVLIKIKATSVSAADYKVRSFDVPAAFWLPAKLALGFTKPRRPILGMEFSGEIVAIGKKVSSFKIGNEVFGASLQTFGSYAEYICLPDHSSIALKPENISLEDSAAIPIGARTAYHYLKVLSQIKPNQKVLIYGASGSVGTYAVQLAKYFGAEVTGVCSTDNLSLIKSLGADKTIDYKESGFLNNLETYDTVFVTIDKCPFSILKNSLKKNGTYLNIGRPLPSLAMIWTSLSTNRKVLVGKNVPESIEILNILKKLIQQGKLKPVIDRKYSLDQIVQAHRYADKGHKRGNVIITIR